MAIEQDHKRFRDIVRGKIRENFKKYITQGEMVGRREKETVKIPIPQIELPKFKYGPKQQGGVGQGDGQPGEEVDGQQSGDPTQAGDKPGEHGLEVDISFDELAEILGEELQLPRIEPKGSKQLESTKYKLKGMAPVGPSNLRNYKASYKEALKRYMSTGTYNPDDPVIVPIKKDLRFRSFKQATQPQSNAVVIYIMDVSGSMGGEQKEVVRLETFWIHTWLKHHYKGLQTRFIIHDAAAKEVDEDTFFKTSEAGGTLISSAYNLLKKMIDEEYNPSEWNIYPFHFSDGDNWSAEDTKYCLRLLKEDILEKVNMFGYGQVESKYGSGQFLKDLVKEFPEDDKLITSRVPNREKIPDSIRDFLGKGK
ncbi:MAG: DUF444 family protein [Bdellovibrionales bacterium]|nr:DUF444 family protein [Bdellovibrionales bacterium]